ncbi:hypothetical protein ElyMa_004368300 [Elysia marginata]|uniref:SAM-dependent MTase RsmB/NOP-type domain-containing protein n=1 Tax=Elysia marginata TaxID=1093978 RepID=A0AAV4H8E8_9GAST|nr:hypothetical protein ElyMa_004368300 [Elysia marginata]
MKATPSYKANSMQDIPTKLASDLRKTSRSQSAPAKLGSLGRTCSASYESEMALHQTRLSSPQTLPTIPLGAYSTTKVDDFTPAQQRILAKAETVQLGSDKYYELFKEILGTLKESKKLDRKELDPETYKYLKSNISKTALDFCRQAVQFLKDPKETDLTDEGYEYLYNEVEETQRKHPTETFHKTVIKLYNFYQQARDDMIELARKKVSKEPCNSYFLAKKLDPDLELNLIEDLQPSHGSSARFKATWDIVNKNRITGKQTEFLKNIETCLGSRLNIYFQATSKGYQLLAEYFKKLSCKHVVEVMAGRGLTAKMLSSHGLLVHACDIKRFNEEKQLFRVDQCDAIKYIKEKSRVLELNNCGLLIAAPPPYIQDNEESSCGLTEIGRYLPYLFKWWHIKRGGPIIIVSEGGKDELCIPASIREQKIKLVPLQKQPPEGLIEELGCQRTVIMCKVTDEI